MNTLPALLRAPTRPSLEAVVASIEPMEPEDRYTIVRTLGRKQQMRLFELCESSAPVARTDFMPESAGTGVVDHRGWNSLPLFRAWRTFSKPMVAIPGTQELGGYNDSSTRWLLGPGYFVCRESDPEYVDRGAWVVDYLRVPESELVDGWPAIKPNEKGLQRFVYGGTRDYMRRVCDGITIGLPFKGDKELAFPFILVRS